MSALVPIRRSRRVLAAFALTLAPLAALADIHIGVTLSTTGPGASLGIPAEQALKMWPGEMAGEKVRFTILNDTTDTTTATKNAQRLITEDKVDLIIGSSVTPTSLAVVETAGAARCRWSRSPAAGRSSCRRTGRANGRSSSRRPSRSRSAWCSTTCRRTPRASRSRRSASPPATAKASSRRSRRRRRRAASRSLPASATTRPTRASPPRC